MQYEPTPQAPTTSRVTQAARLSVAPMMDWTDILKAYVFQNLTAI
ncbi:hypothetical protein [Loktanella salsilacus]